MYALLTTHRFRNLIFVDVDELRSFVEEPIDRLFANGRKVELQVEGAGGLRTEPLKVLDQQVAEAGLARTVAGTRQVSGLKLDLGQERAASSLVLFLLPGYEPETGFEAYLRAAGVHQPEDGSDVIQIQVPLVLAANKTYFH